ncbi:MAG TPA: hypothetical protein VJH55_01885 [Candidatus Paceibacterota bacterium]
MSTDPMNSLIVKKRIRQIGDRTFDVVATGLIIWAFYKGGLFGGLVMCQLMFFPFIFVYHPHRKPYWYG